MSTFLFVCSPDRKPWRRRRRGSARARNCGTCEMHVMAVRTNVRGNKCWRQINRHNCFGLPRSLGERIRQGRRNGNRNGFLKKGGVWRSTFFSFSLSLSLSSHLPVFCLSVLSLSLFSSSPPFSLSLLVRYLLLRMSAQGRKSPMLLCSSFRD